MDVVWITDDYYHFFRMLVDDKSGIFKVKTDQSTGWTHLVLNCIGPNRGEGIKVYINAPKIKSDTTRDESSTWSGNGHVTIGTQVTNENPELFFASVMVGKKTFWNCTLSFIGVLTIYYMTL